MSAHPRLVAAIGNVSMNLGHQGLALVAKKFNITFEKMEDTQLVLFINKQRDKLKLMGSKGVVLGYVRMPQGQRLPVGAIQFIPQTFSGDGRIDIDTAVKTYVENALKTRGKTMSPLEVVRATRTK